MHMVDALPDSVEGARCCRRRFDSSICGRVVTGFPQMILMMSILSGWRPTWVWSIDRCHRRFCCIYRLQRIRVQTVSLTDQSCGKLVDLDLIQPQTTGTSDMLEYAQSRIMSCTGLSLSFRNLSPLRVTRKARDGTGHVEGYGTLTCWRMTKVSVPYLPM